jgi:hypothetical protein
LSCDRSLQEETMYAEEQAETTVVLCATRPAPGIEKEMEARGIRVRWAPSITAATALLDSAYNGTVVITELALREYLDISPSE